MPAGQGKDAERFAAAVESGTPLGATDDADLARELEIVAMLRSRGAEFAPDADTKARAKQRLMAVLAAEHGGQRQAPRHAAVPPGAAELTAPLGKLVERADVDPTAETALMEPITADAAPDADADTDGDTIAEPIPLHGGGRAGRKARHSIGGRRSRRSAPAGLRGRVVFAGAAAAAALLAIASGGVLASSNALPGDTLYPVKRVAESAGLALTFDDASKARRHLEIAATRLSEVEQLARNTQSAASPEVFTTAMDDFDTATNEGSQLLLSAAEKDKGGTAAEDLHKWAVEQSDKLTELEPALPASADTDASLELLERLLGQTASADEDTSRRTAGESEDRSDSGGASEDATPTPDKDNEGSSSGASKTDAPSRSSETSTERENPGLLPDLSPNTNRDEDEKPSGTSTKDEDSSSESDSDSGDEGDGNVSVPLPLLPPVTLPPLLPGMPGITIG